MPVAPNASHPGAVVDIAQDEILTGEAVALDVQPVGFFLRAVGALIDALAVIGLLLAFWTVAGAVVGSGPELALTTPILGIVSLVVALVVVPTAVETATRGRSLGKLAVGGRVVRADGGAIGFRHAAIRALTGVLEIWFTSGAVAGLVGVFSPRAQRLGDLLAGTYSERTRAARLPDPVPGLPPGLVEWGAVADVARLPYRTARRAAQFVRGAGGMDVAARHRAAARLAGEMAPFVSPLPATDAETFVRAVVAARREREAAALSRRTGRVAALTATASDAPRGFPRR